MSRAVQKCILIENLVYRNFKILFHRIWKKYYFGKTIGNFFYTNPMIFMFFLKFCFHIYFLYFLFAFYTIFLGVLVFVLHFIVHFVSFIVFRLWITANTTYKYTESHLTMALQSDFEKKTICMFFWLIPQKHKYKMYNAM